MKLRAIAVGYMKAAALSWLNSDFKAVYIPLEDGTRIQLAGFFNGRMIEPPAVPDTVPHEWSAAEIEQAMKDLEEDEENDDE